MSSDNIKKIITMKKNEIALLAKLVCDSLDIKELRELADYCNDMADGLEAEANSECDRLRAGAEAGAEAEARAEAQEETYES